MFNLTVGDVLRNKQNGWKRPKLYQDDFRPKPKPACCNACLAGYHADPLPGVGACVCPCHVVKSKP